MDCSSSITPHSFKYDVFLSFNVEVARFGFTSYFYKKLLYKQLNFYWDELHLQTGEETSSIKESRISVIIFSRSYAASIQHLEQLVHILECKKLYKQIVIPVYFYIDPSDVRRQTGPFLDSFAKHEKCYDYSRVQRWRDALTEAANLPGYDLHRDFKTATELVDTVVEDILNKLNVLSKKNKIKNKLNVTPLSLPENTRTVDIREEDSGHEDEEAIQVPKITVERMFVAFNLILEIPSAVFDQLSSVHKPQYALVSMLMSLATMLFCIIELVYKGGEARVGWRWGKKKIPWFYHPSPSDKPFGTVTDFIGLLCSIFQCFFSVYYYVSYLRNINDPIKISFWPLVFAFCLLCSTFSKKSHKKML